MHSEEGSARFPLLDPQSVLRHARIGDLGLVGNDELDTWIRINLLITPVAKNSEIFAQNHFNYSEQGTIAETQAPFPTPLRP
jgi:hypothetical protein